MLKKSFVYVLTAILLGIAFMVVPIMTINIHSPQSETLGSSESDSQAIGIESIYRNAQILGKAANNEPVISSLTSVVILTSTSLIIGLMIFFYFSRRK